MTSADSRTAPPGLLCGIIGVVARKDALAPDVAERFKEPAGERERLGGASRAVLEL
jgi:hypothetical protein